MKNVVYCGECKYSEYSRTLMCAYRCANPSNLCPCRGRITYADFYCAYGERKGILENE